MCRAFSIRVTDTNTLPVLKSHRYSFFSLLFDTFYYKLTTLFEPVPIALNLVNIYIEFWWGRKHNYVH